MAVDIHWVFERRHQDGSWAAVFSDIRLQQIASTRGPDTDALVAARELVRRNHPWFSRLSSWSEDGAPVLAPGLPNHVALYTKNYLAGDRAAMEGFRAMRPRLFERHGTITLGELEAGAAPVEPGQNPRMLVSQNAPRAHYLRRLLAHFQAITPQLEEEILFGRVRTGQGGEHPDMDAASNHQRIEAISQKEGLLPIAGDTLRWIVAYGH